VLADGDEAVLVSAEPKFRLWIALCNVNVGWARAQKWGTWATPHNKFELGSWNFTG
jgi:hypothetical protein